MSRPIMAGRIGQPASGISKQKSLRLTDRLLERVRSLADREQVPYHALLRSLIETGVTRLERAAERGAS